MNSERYVCVNHLHNNFIPNDRIFFTITLQSPILIVIGPLGEKFDLSDPWDLIFKEILTLKPVLQNYF